MADGEGDFVHTTLCGIFDALKLNNENEIPATKDLLKASTIENLEKLKLWAKEPNNRINIPKECLHYVKSCLSASLQVMESGEETQYLMKTALLVSTEALRFLRNACAGVEENQRKLVEMSFLTSAMTIIRTVKNTIDDFPQSGLSVIISGIQFLGNLVTSNPSTQECLWNKCFPKFFEEMMGFHDLSVRDLLCMVIYNCCRNQKHGEILIGCKDGLQLVSMILDLCASHTELEWGYFIIEDIVCSGQAGQVYQGLSPDSYSQTILLDLITAKLDELSSSSKFGKKMEDWLPVDSVLVFVDEFCKQADSILHYDRTSEEDPCNVLLVVRALRLLCSASGFDQEYRELKDNIMLLEKCLELLKRTSDADKISKFSNLKTAPTDSDSGEFNPTHGFKRDLIRLLANMCHKHSQNQDKIRELDGIPLILNHTNVDDFNPYICQWAILAMRNILENNQENQQVVADLNRQGLADNSRLQQFGIQVAETEEGKIRVKSEKS